jgi:hypothetical protein
VPNEISDNGVLRSYKNIPRGEERSSLISKHMIRRAVGRETQYLDLFAAIGTTYASGALGIRQGDAIRDIKGYAWVRGVKYEIDTYSGVANAKKSSASYGRCGDEQGTQIYFEASKVVPTANKNRPVNYAVNYYIKYKKIKTISIQLGRDEKYGIVFGVDDNYAKHCGATITSVLCNRKIDADNDKIKIFLIVDLSDENKKSLLH